ncbi:MAG: hypothetical protein E2O68_03505 [Deltaproteobacteria bacterium]|nr:MAG: hypothetical protein E2O68_03505 [Deltaproteobacteria bacterium]
MKYLLLFLIPWIGFSECVDEVLLKGNKLLNLNQKDNIYVEMENRFISLKKIKTLDPKKIYSVQILEEDQNKSDYNDKYLNYYGLPRFRFFLKKIAPKASQASYLIERIGESVKARDIFVIRPAKLDPNKKTLLMLVRHHGNEGTANWIFEGFIVPYLKNQELLSTTQIIVYPMINPDGVVGRSRYNANGFDLNRTWESPVDEVKLVADHLKTLISYNKIDFLLDMHSHKSEDIIYRVDEDYLSLDYYFNQSTFIETLGRYDFWQNGNYIVSNGKEGMSRIFFADNYKINSLTHETLKNIPRAGEARRTIKTLKEQGRALNQAIFDYLN